jgi:hypothetical protein
MIDPDDLIGLQEVAARAKVSSAAVANWRTRFADFPRPVAVLAAGPVFDAKQIQRWLGRRASKGGDVLSDTCFVIGPIGDELAPIGSPDRLRYEQAVETWERIIEPACTEVGLNPVRADKIAKAGEITEQVFRLVKDSDIVIADVSDANPNVMYELGLRHTLAKVTVQIGEYGKLPFDIAVIRTLRFSRTPAGFVDARKNLVSLLATALDGRFDLVTATRVWNPQSAAPNPTSHDREQKNLEHEPEEPGVYELLAEMEAAFPELTALVERATLAMQEMTSLANNAISDVRRNDSVSGGFAGRLRVANKLAAQLSPIADEFESVADGFEKQVTSIDAGMTCLLDAIEHDPTQLKEAGSFPELVRTFVSSVRQANKMQSSFAVAVSDTGKFSKPMRVVTRRIADATRRAAATLAHIEVWDARLDRITAGTSGKETSQLA